MKRWIVLLVAFLPAVSVAPAQAWTQAYGWSPPISASWFSVERSLDAGATWGVIYAWGGWPAAFTYDSSYLGGADDSQLVLLRMSNCNDFGCGTNYQAGLWHNDSQAGGGSAPIGISVAVTDLTGTGSSFVVTGTFTVVSGATYAAQQSLDTGATWAPASVDFTTFGQDVNWAYNGADPFGLILLQFAVCAPTCTYRTGHGVWFNPTQILPGMPLGIALNP